MKVTCVACDKIIDVEEEFDFDNCRFYCSEECKQKKISRRRKSKIVSSCEWCGVQVIRKAYQYRDHKDSFCSGKCLGQWQSKYKSGENSQNWNPEKKNDICANCGSEVRHKDPNSRGYKNRFCNIKCKAEWMSKNSVPEENNFWKGRGNVIVNCSWCGKEKEVPKYREEKNICFFCDDICEGEWKKVNWVGENSPGWRGGKVEVNCAWCGKPKKVWPYYANEFENIFCNMQCKNEWWREQFSGPNNWNWTEKVKYNCDQCGTELFLGRWEFKYSKNHFCSKECHNKYREENSIPENHWNWQGGISKRKHPKEFNNRLRKFVRERDNYCCQECGIPENGKKHHVHHIDYDKNNNRVNNLITLCISCHMKTNHNRDCWQDYFVNMMNKIIKEVDVYE